MPEFIARKKSALNAKIDEHNALVDELNEARDAATPDTTKVDALRERKSAIGAEVTALKESLATLEREAAEDDIVARAQQIVAPVEEVRGLKYDQVARVGKEERTYTAEKSARGEASFFADSFGAQNGNIQARERIQRNLQEAIVEGEISERATTTSSFAGLVVPQYLVDQAALLARAGRPFANTVQRLQLPSQGMSLVIPRGTTGASEAIQATENSSVSSTDQVFANVTVPVVTIAGQQDVSRQSLERGTPGIDSLIYLDLAGAYAVALDSQVLSGSGTSGQMLGVLTTAGIGQSTAFVAAATAATFYSKLAGQLNTVETTRFLAPTAIAMHPRRWNWLVSQVDSSNRPLVVPNQSGPYNAYGVSGAPLDVPESTPVGWILGLPVYTDASIPTAVGTASEDQVIVYRAPDLLLWEDGDGAPKQLRFEQTLGNQLTVKLVAYNYAAFTAGRYPTAVGVVGGNSGAGFGLVAPTF
jgi:HK97 family phage major capsid protein